MRASRQMSIEADASWEAADAVVYVVDDDEPQREAMSDLFRSVGLNSLLFPSVSAFAQVKLNDAPCCLVLDVRLPGMSGLEFQQHLNQAGSQMPIVFITGFADVPMTVRAMKSGAVDFLSKPVRDQELLEAVYRAIASDRARRAENNSLSNLRELYSALSEREKEVMALVSAGLMNKQIAGRLGLSDVTVKIHRGHVMRKMKARSVADLVRMTDRLTPHAQ
jgi:FixJ family two-component response regulator